MRKQLCFVDVIKDLIGPKWTPCILCRLFDGTKRFSDFQRELPKISHKVLAARLRWLEGEGIIIREVIDTIPIQTRYSLSIYGETLRSLADTIYIWVINNPELIFNPECIYFKEKIAAFKKKRASTQQLIHDCKRII